MSGWLKANKLTLNVDKSNLLLFKLNRNQNNKNINISLGQDKLQPKEYAKYFGVFIDSKLTWEKHIQMKNSKLQKEIGILKMMKYFLQENI